MQFEIRFYAQTKEVQTSHDRQSATGHTAPHRALRRARGLTWPQSARRARDSELRHAPVRAPRVAGGELLRHEARRGEHREAAVLELLRLHLAELGRVLGLETQRVETQVARHVVSAELLEDVVRLVRARPADVDAVALDDADAERHREPHERRQVRDLLDRRPAVAREERVELLLDEEARRREHADAAVRELGLAPRAHLLERLALEEVERVEVLDRRDVAREAVAELALAGGLLRGGRDGGGVLEATLLHADGRARRRSERGGREAERERGRQGEHLDFRA